MRINETKLTEIIRKVVKRKLESLKENEAKTNSNYTATKRIILSATTVLNKFQEEIVKELNLVHPDKMDPGSQQYYDDVIKKMENRFQLIITETVTELGRLPKQPDESKTL